MTNLETKVSSLGGVGPKLSAKLRKLGIETVSDLIFYYPRTYRDFSTITKIGEAMGRRDEPITIQGKVLGITNKRTSRRRFYVTEALIGDDTGSIKVVWFNQPFLAKVFAVDREVILNGKIDYNFFSKEVVMESPERSLRPIMVPIYSETAGISSKYISKLILSIQKYISEFREWLPEKYLKRYELSGIEEALFNIHFPKNINTLEKARKRIAFDELFLISLRSNLSRMLHEKETAVPIKIPAEEIESFVNNLPFKLTADQEKAKNQILHDMEQGRPMNRLLNGDVGSGKTVVAAVAAYAANKAGFNVAIMAPTEILANQHYETFKNLFPKEVVGILTSSKKKYGEKTRIFIGTHALIQNGVNLGKLNLVIVDEQHRFGVKQRAALQSIGADKQSRPHFLSMTATPIPRTLQLAFFGDLDLSVIKEKPKDRREIKTRFVTPEYRNKAYEFIRAHIKAGRQVFVVCPLIEEAGNRAESFFDEERKSVKQEYEKLQQIFPEYRIGMLHGKMKGSEKDGIMADFADNKISILVSTSVIEVGIDMPNATVMMIEDADRFGLAQLHQFRGRVGRAEHQSFCFLFSSTISEKAVNRLKALESTADGFKLAEIDLEQRGPGAVFGTEQSGMVDLKLASFSDRILIEQASSAAKNLVNSDPELKKNSALRDKISEYTQNKHLE